MTGTARKTLFITHAAPEDNEFALWLSSKLAMAGYQVWVDRQRLRGGTDTWDEIDLILPNEAIKQIVVFTPRIHNQGVKKKLAIGDIVKNQLNDQNFMIPIRADDIAFSDAPPEFVRKNILNGYPNWHDCLSDLFEQLQESNVPKELSHDANTLRTIIDAREDGRRFIANREEDLLSNWFPIHPPERIRYYAFEGTQDQMKIWLENSKAPHVKIGRLAGSFLNHQEFSSSSSFDLKTSVAYDIKFEDFISVENLGPYTDKSDAMRDIPNLLRQHFSALAKSRGLSPVEFANGEIGWFFPDGLIEGGKVIFDGPDNRKIRRVMSGKCKALRWHVCLIAKPRVWPSLVYRVHVNVVLSEDGHKPLSGDKTHKKRKRLTRSWWNNIWRDRMIAAMHYLSEGKNYIPLQIGHEQFSIATMPISMKIPVSYDANDAPLPREEDDDGNIIPNSELDDHKDDIDEENLEEAA